MHGLHKNKGINMRNRELANRLGVYLVMGLNTVNGLSPLEIAEKAIAGGVDVIQLREKKRPFSEVLTVGRQIRELCKEKNVLFVVNDRVDVAMLLQADGVHVGQDDIPAHEARKIIPEDMFIGVSASSMEEARLAIEQGADYLGVGSIYATNSKDDAGEPVTPALIAEIRAITDLPMVGIGGINAENGKEVLERGANGLAVISAIVGQQDPEQAAKKLKQLLAFRLHS
jgi:thiamine-phosphate pyrophosphorylase